MIIITIGNVLDVTWLERTLARNTGMGNPSGSGIQETSALAESCKT
ncbi:MAG: hypothetical protein VX610_05670 [SAR324 cluster bacterium]|nr:hypothetical protein [SAR324 cluster bacterium]